MKVVFVASEVVSSGRTVVPVFEKKVSFGAIKSYADEFGLPLKKILQVAGSNGTPDAQT